MILLKLLALDYMLVRINFEKNVLILKYCEVNKGSNNTFHDPRIDHYSGNDCH
jgi:hypothetical protein